MIRPRQPVRAVLFDMDGVLVESYEVWFQLTNGAARDLGYSRISREDFHASWGQGVDADVRTFYPGHTRDQVEDYYTRHFRDHGAHLRVDPDGAPVLAELHARNLRTAVITNTPGALAREILSCASLSPQALVGGTDVPHAKPAPDMVLRACSLLGVETSQAIVIGDSHFDAEAAAAAEVFFVGYKRAGDATIDRLREVLAFVQPP